MNRTVEHFTVPEKPSGIHLMLALASAMACTLGGCYTAELDPSAPGAFACDPEEEEPCADGLSCVNERCELTAELPSVLVLSPEDEEALTTTLTDDDPAGVATVSVTLRIQGSMNLVSANTSTEHEFGEGHVVVFVDDEEQAIVDSGSISSPAPVEVEVDAVTGPHRILLQVRRNDGLDYDHDEATATRLFWFESEATRGERPFVAIKAPWPGSEFNLDDVDIPVELATLNFTIVEPGNGVAEREGHSHIHYDADLPSCTLDEDCDPGYVGVVGPALETTIVAPASSERPASIAAVLRHVGHTPYGFPFGCDPLVDTDCATAFDSVTIERSEDAD